MTTSRLIPLLFAAVLAADVTGAAVAMARGLEDAATVIASGTAINAPGPFVCVQALLVLAAVRLRGRGGIAASLVLALLCGVSIASGFTDGSFDASLAAGERAIQAAIVATTAALGVTALIRAARGGVRPLTDSV